MGEELSDYQRTKRGTEGGITVLLTLLGARGARGPKKLPVSVRRSKVRLNIARTKKTVKKFNKQLENYGASNRQAMRGSNDISPTWRESTFRKVYDAFGSLEQSSFSFFRGIDKTVNTLFTKPVTNTISGIVKTPKMIQNVFKPKPKPQPKAKSQPHAEFEEGYIFEERLSEGKADINAGLQLANSYRTEQAAAPLVESLKRTGRLPANYVDKATAGAAGWAPGKAVGNYVPNGQIGGDIFMNTTSVVPYSHGRVWFEADVGLLNTMKRSSQPGTRLLYSNDGLMYITWDHYETVKYIGNYKSGK